MLKKEILKKIKKYNSFLLSTHINPEGDAIGSQFAMMEFLKSLGKKVLVINDEAVPANLNFLPEQAKVEVFSDKCRNYKADAAIILDCPSLERVGRVKELAEKLYIINIDHHISNTKFGDINWVDDKASAAGELVYELFKKSRVKLNKNSALNLYVAIMTDTGSFSYSNTRSKTHKIIADLLEYEINPSKIYESIYETKSFNEMLLLGETLINLKQTQDGRIIWITVKSSMLKKHNLTAENTDDFIDFVRTVKTAQVVAFLREINSGKSVKVSLRSKSGVDVNKIARHFGGGGHYLASGCVIERKLPEAEKLLIGRIKKEIK